MLILALIIKVEVEMITILVNTEYIIDLSRGTIIGTTADCKTTCYENFFAYFMLKPFSSPSLQKNYEC